MMGLEPIRGVPTMQLNLTDHEAHLLHQVLESYLKELRGEIVDTDNASFKRELKGERDALVAIAQRLEGSAGTSPSAITKMVRVTAVLTEYD
jgi:acetolactate synthase small subunit